MWLWVLLLVGMGVDGGIIRASQKSGLWSNNDTWCPFGIPREGDHVVISNNTQVIFDVVGCPVLKYVEIEEAGALIFDNGQGESDTQLELKVETILVKGYFEIGQEDNLFTRKAQITLLNTSPAIPRSADLTPSLFLSPYNSKMIAVYQNGRWEVHAKGRNITWTKLNKTIKKGDTSLQVVEAVDWQVGDEIVVACTDYSPNQTERVIITSIEGAGTLLHVDRPFSFGHFGELFWEAGFKVDMRAEVAVLNSNVKLIGDMNNSVPYSEVGYESYGAYIQYGGHSIFVDNSYVRLEGIAIKHFGQGGRLARYPVHWHYRGDAPGQYIKRCSIYDSFTRAVTIHATNFVLIKDVVGFNGKGHLFYLEDGTEEENMFVHNLALNAESIGTSSSDQATGSYHYSACSTHPPGLRLQFLDYAPAGFWITNVNNTFVGNSAAGCHFGYWVRTDLVFSEPNYPCTVCTAECRNSPKVGEVPSANKNMDGLVFVDNVAHSNTESGWWIKENWTPTKVNYVKGFLLYKNNIGLDNYGTGAMIFDSIIAVDNSVGAQVEHQRVSSSAFINSLFIGESINHGNPFDIVESVWYARPTNCSAIYPGVWRTERWFNTQPKVLLRLPPNWGYIKDSVFLNELPGCGDVYLLGDHASLGYPANNVIGAINWPSTGEGSILPPDSVIHNVQFYKTNIAPPSGDPRMRNGGWLDIDGSLPCSAAGAQWFYNQTSVLPPTCEFRPAFNMFYCPPAAGAYYKSIKVSSPTAFSGQMTIQYECQKQDTGYQLHSPYDLYYIQRTDKLVHISFSQPPTVLRFSPYENPVLPNSFGGVELVVVYPGIWQVGNGANTTTLCGCDTTYIRITLTKPIQLTFTPFNSSLCSLSCPATNPWPIPSPSDYLCADTRKQSQASLSSCPFKPLDTTPRYWPEWPTLPSFNPLPLPPAPGGVQNPICVPRVDPGSYSTRPVLSLCVIFFLKIALNMF